MTRSLVSMLRWNSDLFRMGRHRTEGRLDAGRARNLHVDQDGLQYGKRDLRVVDADIVVDPRGPDAARDDLADAGCHQRLIEGFLDVGSTFNRPVFAGEYDA